MALLREHFAGCRPLVAATALGGAAAVFDAVTARLSARRALGDLRRLRYSALITLGRTHVQLATALLGAVTASHLAEGDTLPRNCGVLRRRPMASHRQLRR